MTRSNPAHRSRCIRLMPLLREVVIYISDMPFLALVDLATDTVHKIESGSFLWIYRRVSRLRVARRAFFIGLDDFLILDFINECTIRDFQILEE